MGRPHAQIPRLTYSFRLNPENVEKVREQVPDLSEWVEDQFQNKVDQKAWSEERSMAWRKWLASRSEAVKQVAEQYPPTLKYALKGDDSGNWYVIRQYNEEKGKVTLTCEKMGPDGGTGVTGIPPSELTPQ